MSMGQSKFLINYHYFFILFFFTVSPRMEIEIAGNVIGVVRASKVHDILVNFGQMIYDVGAVIHSAREYRKRKHKNSLERVTERKFCSKMRRQKK